MAEEERPEEEPEKIEIEEVAEAKPVRAAVTPVIRRRKPMPVRPARRVAEPVKKMPSPKTVKGKIAAIQKACANIYSGAREIQQSMKDQVNENQQAVAAMNANVKEKIEAINTACANIRSGAREIQQGTNEQMKENLEAIAAMQSGVNRLQADIKDHMKKHQDAVAAMQSAISGQMNENQTYVRNFYG